MIVPVFRCNCVYAHMVQCRISLLTFAETIADQADDRIHRVAFVRAVVATCRAVEAVWTDIELRLAS